MTTLQLTQQYVRVASLSDIQEKGVVTAQVEGHTLALFAQGGGVFAVDNRCPHMGFPLHQGTVKDGILTCHWHHARFDLESGGTFDQWADDVRVFPTEIRDGDVYVDLARHYDPVAHHQQRLRVGLERNISLVIAKAVLTLLDQGGDAVLPFRVGLEFGATYRWAGWGQGLTILACLMNMLSYLDDEDRPRALYQGLSAVASELNGQAPRFPIRPLPTTETDIPTLKRWYRNFIEVRDAEGAERCVISAIKAGATPAEMADMLFAAATDHRYIRTGHVTDFINKAFDALDIAGWDLAETVLPSLVRFTASAARMEESNAWRNPVDLVAILETTFAQLPGAVQSERAAWDDRDALVTVLLGDDPQAIADALLAALTVGATMLDVAETVTYAAALRIARFHTSNEFGDWDTALHTFSFANAIEHGLRRAPSLELLRGVFDAAMSIYLDRFLNIPPARLPEPDSITDPERLLPQITALLDQQQQVNEAAELAAQYLASDGDPERLLALLGKLLLREDRDFHTIQTVETALAQYRRLREEPEGAHVLIAAFRYLAAHSPTVRAQGQTYHIAERLHRGDHLFEE